MAENKKFDYNNPVQLYWRILREAFLPNAWKFGIATGFMLVSSSMVAYRAYLIKPAIDKVFLEKNTTALLFIPVQLIIVAIAASVSTFMHQYLMQKTTTDISISYQKKLFNKLMHTDMDFYMNKTSHKIMDLFNDVGGLINAMRVVFTGLIADVFSVVGLVSVMFYQSPKLACIAFIGFPILLLPFHMIRRYVKKLAEQGHSISGNINHVIGEALSLIEVVKSTGSEDKEVDKFNNIAMSNFRVSMGLVRLSLMSSPLMEMAGTIGFAGVIWYGGSAVINGTLTTGAFFTMITALLSAYKPAKGFAGLGVQIQQALIAAKRLFITLDKEQLIKDKPNAVELKNVKGNVELKDVVFYYPLHEKGEPIISEDDTIKYADTPALKGVSLSIKQGQSVALVGHSGSGKSTIFKLIQRFYDTAGGSIKIDGKDIKDVSLHSLKRAISVVSQDVALFSTTIRENVAYGVEKASEKEIKRACDLANASEFINTLRDGLDTLLGPNGAMLSGGQKQRISIARAILRNSPILLLDEATSALDPISEKLIQKALHVLMKNRTTIIIAHRLSTVQNCDNIFVMRHGNIIESGTHKTLLAKEGHYAELYRKQFEKAAEE